VKKSCTGSFKLIAKQNLKQSIKGNIMKSPKLKYQNITGDKKLGAAAKVDLGVLMGYAS
jgi:hypothetical protein